MKKNEELRSASIDDAGALAALHIRSWQVAYRGILPSAYLDSLDLERRTAFWRRFLGEGAEVIVAEADRVVGFCFPTEANEAGWGEISSIYVHPDHWGCGYGTQLIGAGESVLSGRGFDRALLWVLEDNHLGRFFYEARGWKRSKRFQILEIGGTPVTELRYEKSLRAEI